MTERIQRARIYLLTLLVLVLVAMWSAVSARWSVGQAEVVPTAAGDPQMSNRAQRIANLERREQAVQDEARRAAAIVSRRQAEYRRARSIRLRQIDAAEAAAAAAVTVQAPTGPALSYSAPPISVAPAPAPSTTTASS